MNLRSAIFAISIASFAVAAQAQEGRLEVATTAEKEQLVTGADGAVSKRLVPVDTAVPGDEIIYTVTFTNISNERADNVRVTNPIPAEMAFIPGSAFGPGTDISYSVDGGASFAAADQLLVATEEGDRPAMASDYTHIRWVMQQPLDAGARGFARYRAKLR